MSRRELWGQDDGVGSILMLTASILVLAGTLVVALFAQVHHARVTAAAAADAAALAAAHHLTEGRVIACLSAEHYAIDNGALMTGCTAQDEQVQVHVLVRMHGALSRLGPMKATARARLTWR